MKKAEHLWYRIESGEHTGRWHLRGWLVSKPRPDLMYGICPRCFALVPIDNDDGDRMWGHEDWHSRTDYPHRFTG